MSFITAIENALKKIGHSIAGIFTKENEAKVTAFIDKTLTLAKEAEPIVALIASVIPGAAIPEEILKAAIAIGEDAQIIFDSTNKLILDGGRQKIAAELLKQHLLDVVAANGKVSYGHEVIQTAEDVLQLPGRELENVVLTAYNLFKDLKVKA